MKSVKRRVFFCFHYEQDVWRAAQIRNAGTLDGNEPISDNDWEETKGSEVAIKKWIDDQMHTRSCTVVLIGSHTAGRDWIKYEIEKSWHDGKGLLGIYIHQLLDKDRRPSGQGRNPFDNFTVPAFNGLRISMSSAVPIYNPPYMCSKDVYSYITNNIADWVEEAI